MRPRLSPPATLLLLFATASYLIFVTHHLSLAYLDFGDGNYLYISARMAEGVGLYSGILSPQPPLHLYAGALVFKFFDAPLPGLWLLRYYTALLHVATAGLVFLASLRLFGRPREAAVAYSLALFLPIGFWWTLGFQSEATSLPLLLLAFYAQLRGGRGWMLTSGLASAAALHTNMTSLPYVILYSLAATSLHRRHAGWFLAPLLLVYGGVFALFQWATGGEFLGNIWSNQVGSFPPRLWDHGPAKLLSNGMVIVDLEGAWILLALGGMLAATRLTADPDTPLLARRPGLSRFVLWAGVLHLGSLLFMLKGGTANYIFMLAEPMVALFAARALSLLSARWRRTLRDLHPVALAARVLVGFCLLCLLAVPPLRLHAGVWTTNWERLGSQTAAALARANPTNSPEREVVRALAVIQAHSQPDEPILAPPFYAFASGRRLAGEVSETYIIGIRYLNLRAALAESEEETLTEAVVRLGERAPRNAQSAARQVQEVVEALESRQVGVVLWQVDRSHPFYMIPEIRQALERNYRPLPEAVVQTANEKLVFYLPR